MKKVIVVLLCLYLVGLCFGDNNGNNGNGNGNSDCVAERGQTVCPRCIYKTQDALDECYMKEALRFGTTQNPAHPYGTLIVNHYTNTISCYGVNHAQDLFIYHGEMSAMINCSQLYPSPTNNDNKDPGLVWRNQTMYTTGESCPMCAMAAIWRGLGRMVFGTGIPTLVRVGSVQVNIRNRELFKEGLVMMYDSGNMGNVHGNIPYLKGGVLRNETDAAFFRGFGLQGAPIEPQWGTDEDVFMEEEELPQCGCGLHHGEH